MFRPRSRVEFEVNRYKAECTWIDLAHKIKTLGSRLDCVEIIQAYINLAELSMRKLQGMWGAYCVNLSLKVQLYNAYIH